MSHAAKRRCLANLSPADYEAWRSTVLRSMEKICANPWLEGLGPKGQDDMARAHGTLLASMGEELGILERIREANAARGRQPDGSTIFRDGFLRAARAMAAAIGDESSE